MIITFDGMDFSGKSTLIREFQKKYGGDLAQKATEMGIIPMDIQKRLKWYNESSSTEILEAVLQSDILRRYNSEEKGTYFLVDRGEITVLSDCIAKTVLKENCSYNEARDFVNEIKNKLNYFPREDLRVYLTVSENDIPLLEKRKYSRGGGPFSKFEKEYYPLLLAALKEKSLQLSCLEIYAIQPIGSVLEKIDIKSKNSGVL